MPCFNNIMLTRQPIREQERALALLHRRAGLTMAADEADAALHHQRNGFSRVLKRMRDMFYHFKEHETGDHCGNKTHVCALFRNISKTHTHTHTSAYEHASMHMLMCARGGRVQHPAVARRRHFFPFSLCLERGFHRSNKSLLCALGIARILS